MYYIGLDVHKRTISYCVKDAAGCVLQEGKIGSSRRELEAWIKTLPQPRMMAMEATIFTGWIYDYLLPHAEKIKVAHPLMLRAIAAAKKKNDRIDAAKIADCLRCDFLPECHMASTEIRDRRRSLRYRNLVLRQMVQMKNRVSGLLMETGVSYNKQRLHKVGYFTELLSTHEEINASIRPLLQTLPRAHPASAAVGPQPDQLSGTGPAAVGAVATTQDDPRSRPGHRVDVGLEIGDYARFRSIKQAISYCGLCSAENSSADKRMRMPISKQRNKHIQHVLIEAAKLAPRYSHQRALLRDKEMQGGNANQATIAVARKLVAYLLAVDRRKQDFVPAEELAGKAVA